MAKTPKPGRRPSKNPSSPQQTPDLPEGVVDALPPLAQDYIRSLRERLKQLEGEVEKLKATLAQNSSNSNRPPSSDSPFRRADLEHARCRYSACYSTPSPLSFAKPPPIFPGSPLLHTSPRLGPLHLPPPSKPPALRPPPGCDRLLQQDGGGAGGGGRQGSDGGEPRGGGAREARCAGARDDYRRDRCGERGGLTWGR